jgi:transposase
MDRKVVQLMESAASTVGVRMNPWDMRALRDGAQEAAAARKQMKLAVRRLAQLALAQPTIQAMGRAVGLSTACVLWLCLGDPHNYPCAAAYVKAMGLNLCERSSGTYKGRVKISKRGFGMVRYWMYLAAMRLLKEGPVQSWFLAKKERDQNKGGKALVALMRRLGMALWHVGACGEVFEPGRLFGGGQRRQKDR